MISKLLQSDPAQYTDGMNKPEIPLEAAPSSHYPYRLMAPGPVQVHPRIFEVMSLPLLHHRTPQFAQILRQVLNRLKKVFLTNGKVFVLAGTGSGGMEAALVNSLSPGDRILAIESGKFGERWAEMARDYGIQVDSIAISWGASMDPERLRRELQINDYKAVLTQACETSTGALHPLQEMGKVVREKDDCLLIVDGITAVGATNLPMDEWGLDIVVGGSQKAFMLPTGLSMVAVSEKAWSRVLSARLPRHYWNLVNEDKMNQKDQTQFSSAVSLIRGLDVALSLMLQEGLSQHLKRIQSLADATRKAGELMDLKIFPEMPSPSLTVFELPEDVDGQRVRQHLEDQYQVTIAGGQDRVKGKILRIGHMGAISNEDAIATMELLNSTLAEIAPQYFNKDKNERIREVMKAHLPEASTEK